MRGGWEPGNTLYTKYKGEKNMIHDKFKSAHRLLEIKLLKLKCFQEFKPYIVFKIRFVFG